MLCTQWYKSGVFTLPAETKLWFRPSWTNWHWYLLNILSLVQGTEIIPSFSSVLFHMRTMCVVGVGQTPILRYGEHSKF
jgi:hypothetical protein